VITFTVRGIPAPQGSKRAFRNKHSGRIQQVESSKRVAPWRSDVRDAADHAIDAWTDAGNGQHVLWELLTGPVAIELAFRWPRPKGHFGTGRNAGVLKTSAPSWPAGPPDVDKLARAVLDALTGLVFADDAQVVDLGLRKRYADGEPPGVTVTVHDLAHRREAPPRTEET
jgi:Holliday junction resolvase RusA-like endonuclease